MTIRNFPSIKHFALLFTIICTTSTLHAQSPSSTWARLIKGTVFGGSVAADASGNAYVTGIYSGTITIGSTELSTRGSMDIFLAKFDPQGNPVWARSAGGTGHDTPRQIAVDAAGNCFLTGVFNGTATFGSVGIVSAGYTDGFLAKYDAKGECAWVVTIGGRFDDGVSGVCVDARGNSVLVGTFTDAFILGNGQLIAPAGGSDFLAMKFDANGACLWAIQGGGAGDDGGSGASVDSSGNVYVIGSFSGSVRIGSDALTSDGTE